jgi:hypothetical protein
VPHGFGKITFDSETSWEGNWVDGDPVDDPINPFPVSLENDDEE